MFSLACRTSLEDIWAAIEYEREKYLRAGGKLNFVDVRGRLKERIDGYMDSKNL